MARYNGKETEECVKMSAFDSEIHYFHETDYIAYATFNLLTARQANQEYALDLLHEKGYEIWGNTNVQVLLVDINPYFPRNKKKESDAAMQEWLLQAARRHFPFSGIDFLICTNRYRQYVIVLCSNGDVLGTIPKENYQNFYEFLCEDLTFSFSCYFSKIGKLWAVKEILLPCDQKQKDNVAKKPGLYLPEENFSPDEKVGIETRLKGWEYLLNTRHFVQLEKQLISFIDFNSSIGQFNLKKLQAFHQELIELFFVYTYHLDIDMEELFDGEYSYDDFMNCYKDVFSLKQGISYFIKSISEIGNEESVKTTVQEAMDYITANLSREISLMEVAEHIHFSPEYLSKIFKKETGENIKKYILRRKMEAAKNMLCNPAIPIHEVAEKVGYDNFSHFTQIFKKYEHRTPSEYRKEIQRTQESPHL